MKKPILLLVAISLACFSAMAQLRLPAIFGDHMVLQQQSEAAMWGWAGPGDRKSVV